MMLSSWLPVYLLLLSIDSSSAHESSFLPRALHHARRAAVNKTHSLARDLRVAFRGILVARDGALQSHPVVYCKPSKQAPFNNGGGSGTSGGNTTSTSSSGTKHPTSTKSSTGAPTSAPTNVPASSDWKLTNTYAGNTFFDQWDFFTGSDPTSGIVDYLDENTARSSGLLEVNSQGNAVMRVETTPNVAGNRKSIRIQTKAVFNGALLTMDAVHMPTGCGIWPAFWTNGPHWPSTGEIDIVEGVHDYTNNQATIHTDVGCTLPSTNANTLAISGTVIANADCAALTTGNQGCGIRASSSNSFGAGFNSVGGGLYAMKWDSSGVAIWFFARGSIPADLTADLPQPDSWGPAMARWPAASCDPFKFFVDHSAIFDTTLCGDWAGGVWNAAGIPGQEQSCAQRTGFSTCEAFVRASGSAMSQAYWEVSSVKAYQLKN